MNKENKKTENNSPETNLKNISLSDMNIFKLDIFSKLLLSLSFEFDKLIEAFSTNKCGFGNGLYEIFPVEFRYNLKFL